MTLRRFLLIGLAFLTASRLAATTVVPPGLDTLLAQSDCVVRAVVKSATPEWHEHDGRRYISTRVELVVSEVVKGTPPSTLILDLLGGRIGEDELVVTGMPALRAGEEHILFVRGGQQKLFPLVAMMHGLYPVLREAKSGQEYVLRSNGMPLYSLDDVSLPMEQASALVRQNPSARPLTASSFIQQLRARIRNPQIPNREN